MAPVTWLVRAACAAVTRRPAARMVDALESIGTTFDDDVSRAADAVERPTLSLDR